MTLTALVGRSFTRISGLIAGVALLLGALQAALVFVAGLHEETQSFDLIAKLAPSFVQRQFGSSFNTFMSFAGLTTFGYFHPVVLLLLTMFTVFAATELAADVEGGHVDLLLSRAVPRRRLVTRSLLIVLLLPLLLVGIMLGATYASLRLYAPEGARWPADDVLLSMAGHLVALAWCMGGIGLAAAAHVRRRASALGPVAIAAVTLYLVDLLAPAWRVLEPVARVSPFHYFEGPVVLGLTAGTATDFAVLCGIAAAAVAAAYWRFSVRDV